MANSSRETVYTQSPKESRQVQTRHNLPKSKLLRSNSAPRKRTSRVQFPDTFPPSKINNCPLTDHEEYLAGTYLTKRPEHVREAKTTSNLLVNLTGLGGSDLDLVTGFEQV